MPHGALRQSAATELEVDVQTNSLQSNVLVTDTQLHDIKSNANIVLVTSLLAYTFRK